MGRNQSITVRGLFIHIALLLPLWSYSQFYTGDSTKLALGPNTTLFTGGNATYNGPLFNSGTIVSNRDADFVSNTTAGNLKFSGPVDQNLNGDTINVGSFEVDKTGRLILLTNQVRVLGNMLLANGVVQADENSDLLAVGSVDETGLGYVEGKMIGRVGNASTFTFPMGITDAGTGLRNYLTLAANDPGTFVRVECRPANPNLLFPDSTINGIADEVEWLVSIIGQDSIQATMRMDYSGLVSLANFVGVILADIHIPAIALFDRQDTLHHPLISTTQFDRTNTDPDGRIESNERVWINNTPKRFSIALVPSASEPVFYIPNVFAPNATFSDNRIFRPFFAGPGIITRITITIFDSFNQVVYAVDESGTGLILEDYGWDGILSSGLDAPDGVYYFDITLETSLDRYRSVDLGQRAVLLVR